ncbi:MAG: hypothetical protein H8E15_04230 [Planctomycetes bacterium]|nr:hypothetical protein [Planctomycetota bacterium]
MLDLDKIGSKVMNRAIIDVMANYQAALKPWEKEYLKPLLYLCINLHLEVVQPRDDREEHFLKVLRGVEKPWTAYEFLYLRVLLNYQLHWKAGAKRWRGVFVCRVCSSPILQNAILEGKATGTCYSCAGAEKVQRRKRQTSAQRSNRVPTSGVSPRPCSEQAGTPTSQLFSFKYGGERKGTGIYEVGGFADYDYDHISPHGIPRKKR